MCPSSSWYLNRFDRRFGLAKRSRSDAPGWRASSAFVYGNTQHAFSVRGDCHSVSHSAASGALTFNCQCSPQIKGLWPPV
jgi:hypothetical protein